MIYETQEKLKELFGKNLYEFDGKYLWDIFDGQMN